MHGKVPMGAEKPTDIVAMLRHFFRVTAVKKGCVTSGLNCMVMRSLTSLVKDGQWLDESCLISHYLGCFLASHI